MKYILKYILKPILAAIVFVLVFLSVYGFIFFYCFVIFIYHLRLPNKNEKDFLLKVVRHEDNRDWKVFIESDQRAGFIFSIREYNNYVLYLLEKPNPIRIHYMVIRDPSFNDEAKYVKISAYEKFQFENDIELKNDFLNRGYVTHK